MPTSYNTLLVTLEDGVQTITLNRPDVLNCMSTEAYREMASAFDAASNDPAVDCVVLKGAGRAFCTGGDLKEIAIAAADGKLLEKIDEFADSSMAAFQALENCQKLVIAVVTGICQASGVSMVLSSDLVLAADDATFKVPEVLVGLADPFIAARLFGRVGIARAKWLAFTADKIGAEEALESGLVNRIMPADDLPAAVADLTATLALTSPKSRAEYKRGMNEALPALDPNIMLRANRSPDAVEGTTAFMEKRAPVWPQLPPTN
jgi:2-(1,2-epoxy-1,2-dihydrophenyl)acetyl-CoA isomerase